MFDEAVHGFCSEFYTVEKTIEVVANLKDGNAQIKIEALRDERTGDYSTKAYLEESVTLQPTYPQSGDSFDRGPENFLIWVAYNLPWTSRKSADEVLKQALGFLRAQCVE